MTATVASHLSAKGRAAQLHARRGNAVFSLHSVIDGRCDCNNVECSSPGKHPWAAGGFKRATKSAKTVGEIWARRPDANIGIATGAVSGIAVLDIDLDHGGEETLVQLEKEHGALPPTLTARTGGGGRHLYFKHPGGVVPCSQGKLGPGLDVRGDGGYVVAPGSVHASGAAYTWLDERDPAEAPAWLLTLMRAAKSRATAKVASVTESTPVTPAAASATSTLAVPPRGPKEFGPAGGTPYGLAALEQEARRVEQTPEGGRNAALNKAAFAIGQLVAGGELDRNFAVARVLGAGIASGLGEDEVVRTAKSGFFKGTRHPRSAPPREVPTGADPGDTTPSRRRNPPVSSLDPGVSSPSPGREDAHAVGGDEPADEEPSGGPDWRDFPIEALPPALADLVREGAAAIGCDPSYIALPMLSVAAAAVGNSRTIELKKGWREACVVWTAIIGESGTHKSPAQDLAVAPLRRRDEEEQREHAEGLKLYKAEKLRHEVALTEWRKNSAVGDPPAEPERPVALRFIVCDATTEAVAKLLAENPRGLLLARDELAGWLRSFDAYRAGMGGDAAFFLSTHGARPHVVDRKGGDGTTIFVPRAALSISGAIQPGTLASNLGREHIEDGLLARLLLALPPRTVAKWTTAVVDELTRATYAKVIDELLALDLHVDADGNPEPVAIPLSVDAQDEWISFFNTFAERQGNTVGDEAAALAKLVSYAARFALIHQLVRDPRATSIDVEAVRAGALLCGWFADEAARVYAVLVESPEAAARRRLVEWIAAPPRSGRTTARDLSRGPREYRSTKFAENALDGLVSAKLGTWEEQEASPQGGRPTRVFVLKKTAVEEVQHRPATSSPPASSPPGDGDETRKASLEDGRFRRQEGVLSPEIAADTAGAGACGA